MRAFLPEFSDTPASETKLRHPAQVLLLPPNAVCLLRLLLALAAAAAAPSAAPLAFWLFAVSLALDALDGWLARQLQQETAFGAFLDVAVDNFTRALLWCAAAAGCGRGSGSGMASAWAALPIALEGVTFACTHAGGGAAWKTGCFRWVAAG
jgi:CDP-diacylglycerol--inositol 3-phosphatidyltransferase